MRKKFVYIQEFDTLQGALLNGNDRIKNLGSIVYILQEKKYYIYVDDETKYIQLNTGDNDLSGTSKLFPNGIKFVSEDRELQANDSGCILFLVGNAKVTMPIINPFVSGDYIGFTIGYDSNESGFNVSNGQPLIKSYIPETEFQFGEIVIFNFQEVSFEENGEQITIMFPSCLNSSILYYDNKLLTSKASQAETEERIITLGTITFSDINSKPETIDIFISKTYQMPNGYYIDKLFIKQTEVFDGGLQQQDLTDNNTGFSETIPNGIVEKIFNPILFDYVNSFDYHASFDAGNNEVNPKNLTSGLITIKALIKKLPF